MLARMRAVLPICGALWIGCGANVEPAAAVDASRPDTVASETASDATASQDGSVDAHDAFDAFGAFDGRDPRWPITREQADCLGFSATQTCVSCHLRDGVIYLRPPGAPPPPHDHPVGEERAECGITPP